MKHFSIYTLFFFLLIPGFANQPVVKNNKSAENEYPALFYSYDANLNGTYKVYVQIEDSLYAMFKVVHQVDKKQNKNLWRVMDSYFVVYQDNKMTNSTQLLTPGENEFVWLSGRTGVTEFTGGFHGNERIDSLASCFVKFYADDVELNHTITTGLIPCSTFYYHQVSTMHQTGTGGTITSTSYVPVPGFPIECLHEKKTTFSSKGYTTYNKVTWADNRAAMKRMYYGIFCVGNDISKYGYNDLGAQNPTIVQFVSDNQFKLKSDKQRIVMYNDQTNKSVICDAEVLSGGLFQLNTSVWDTGVYHKYYTAIQNNSPIQTSNNEVWETTASIKFDKYTNLSTAIEKEPIAREYNRVYVKNGKILVENALVPLYLYDQSGRVLSVRHAADNNIVEFEVQNKGIYIVGSESSLTKVIF